MSIRLQISILIVIVILLVYIINSLKKEKINFQLGLVWIALCLIAIILDCFPGIIYWATYIFGFELSSNMIFLVADVLLIVTTYILTGMVSRLSDKVRRLTQELAILSKKNDDMEKRISELQKPSESVERQE